MHIELNPHDAGTALVNIQGRVDAAAAPTFKQQLTDAIAQGNVKLALHLAHVGLPVAVEDGFNQSRNLAAMGCDFLLRTRHVLQRRHRRKLHGDLRKVGGVCHGMVS